MSFFNRNSGNFRRGGEVQTKTPFIGGNMVVSWNNTCGGGGGGCEGDGDGVGGCHFREGAQLKA